VMQPSGHVSHGTAPPSGGGGIGVRPSVKVGLGVRPIGGLSVI
jgi:hypothetical protein